MSQGKTTFEFDDWDMGWFFVMLQPKHGGKTVEELNAEWK